MNHQKYKKAYHEVPAFARTWPTKQIAHAPIWCSVDLRDGNQALYSPMTLEEKIEFFNFLVKLGFKEIEVSFAAASDTEFNFVRYLIENDLIPDDVTIQVLTQSRQHIIERTVESLRGVKNAIIHLYNSTSTLQRRVVFGKKKQEIIDLAVSGARQIKKLADQMEGNIRFEYSPESFTCTEMEFALEICNAVIREFAPTPDRKMVINLPSSIEVSSPNIFADQIEYMSNNLKNRDNVIISVHAHNDRGTAVAASELALLAGAQRVEGTLFGNGERTGNADLIVTALNMFMLGIDPGLNLDHIDEIIDVYQKFNRLPIHPRHPYAGEMAYVAFSGSHQDAIKKSMDYAEKHQSDYWANPYLTIDPTDLQRQYEPIQINSQSGKGGVRYVMENKFGYTVPKDMLAEFSGVINVLTDQKQSVMSPEEIYCAFEKEYINQTDKISLVDYTVHVKSGETILAAQVVYKGKAHEITAAGNGPLDAMSRGLRGITGIDFEIVAYSEHALSEASSSAAVSYIALKNGKKYWGVGIDSNISTSSIHALMCALNKMI